MPIASHPMQFSKFHSRLCISSVWVEQIFNFSLFQRKALKSEVAPLFCGPLTFSIQWNYSEWCQYFNINSFSFLHVQQKKTLSCSGKLNFSPLSWLWSTEFRVTSHIFLAPNTNRIRNKCHLNKYILIALHFPSGRSFIMKYGKQR